MKTGIVKNVQAFGGTESGGKTTYYQFEVEIKSGDLKDVAFLWKTSSNPWLEKGDVIQYEITQDKNGKNKLSVKSKLGSLMDWERQHLICYQTALKEASAQEMHSHQEIDTDRVLDITEIYYKAIISLGEDRP